MLTIRVETTISATPPAIWKAWVPKFAMRPREEEARNLNLYPLGYGIQVPVTLTAVNEMRNWTLEHALPRGKLVIDHWLEPLAEGRVRVGKTYEVYGPMAVVYRLFFARRIRKSAPEEFAALEVAANR